MMNAWLKGKANAHNNFSKGGGAVKEQWAPDANDQQTCLQRGYLTSLKRTGEFFNSRPQTTCSNDEMEQLRRITERARA